jgi:hypothetical protein
VPGNGSGGLQQKDLQDLARGNMCPFLPSFFQGEIRDGGCCSCKGGRPESEGEVLEWCRYVADHRWSKL